MEDLSERGVIADFDDTAGYGHIRTDDGGVVFFHCTQIADGSRSIDTGLHVTFHRLAYLGQYQAAGIEVIRAADEARRSSTMRLVIDSEKCQGHNRCYALAPELVDVDDLGIAFVIGDGELADDQVAQARLLVANCPEFAITVEG